jgi:hypothetical protein
VIPLAPPHARPAGDSFDAPRDSVTYVTGDDPFQLLGLPTRPDLSDDEVRAAWRRIAAATHPDRPDGGDGERFATAAAAYAVLRTAYGRGEAYADLRGTPAATVTRAAAGDAAGGGAGGVAASTARPAAKATRADVARLPSPVRLVWRMRNGRPAILALRLAIAVVVTWTCVAVAGWQPATLAIAVGVLTWLIRTSRYDLATPAA